MYLLFIMTNYLVKQIHLGLNKNRPLHHKLEYTIFDEVAAKRSIHYLLILIDAVVVLLFPKANTPLRLYVLT